MTDKSVAYCPFCGSPAERDRHTGMSDCRNPECRMRFLVSYARQKRRSPARHDEGGQDEGPTE